MSNKTEETDHAVTAFDRATIEIRKAVPGKPGFSAENKYGEAYQLLVRLGVKPQLRRKYRGR